MMELRLPGAADFGLITNVNKSSPVSEAIVIPKYSVMLDLMGAALSCSRPVSEPHSMTEAGDRRSTSN
jgi:hypothetical protein